MSEVKIPKGYKQTEVGVIPEDWELLAIGDVASFSGGSQPPRSTFLFSPRPDYIRLIQIRDYKTSNFETYIPEKLANKKCNDTDIMIGRYGPPIFQILRGIEGAYNVALIKATPSNEIQREYLYYFLKTEKLFQLMELLSRRSSGQTGVELPALKAYPIPLPPKPEQTVIANVLTDTDNLIQSLEKLIAKKEAIKTGTMQQLLTGKTRLPEFATYEDGSAKGFKQTELGKIPEDWEVVSLSQLAQIDPENLPSTTPKDYEFSYISLERIDKGVLLGTDNYLFSNAPSRARRVLRHNDVLISTVRPNLMSHYIVKNYPSNLICSTGFSVVRSNLDKLSPNFFYQHLFDNYINSQIDVLITGSNYPAINSRDVRNLLLPLPSIEEQTAIANILSDMDAEIQALKDRLEKTKAIKQGMMQQLLTGKVRLV